MRTTIGTTGLRSITGLLLMSAFVLCSLYFRTALVDASGDPKPTPTPKVVKYSDFPHSQKAHQMECGKCHTFPSDNWNKVRTGDKAFPDVTEYPKHQACVGCHKQQFFKGTPPKICSICHVSSFPPRDSTRQPFPNPREIFDLSQKGKTAQSDFVVGFPHDKHIEIVSSNPVGRTLFVKASFVLAERRRAGEESCGVCHQTYKPQGDSKEEFVTPPPPKLGDGFWLKKGSFKTAPVGHTTCFTCHNADMGILPAPSSCAACHQLKPAQPVPDFDPKVASAMSISDKIMLAAWRRRESSGKFQHNFFGHTDSSCSTCHNVLTMNTADPLTQKVNISSCAMCHATPSTGDGGALNDEVDKRTADGKFQCVKCHITFGTMPIPKTHTDAIAAAKGK